MPIEGELARAGIVTTDSATIIAKPMEVSEDLVVYGTTTINADTVIDGDLTVLGSLTGTFGTKYVLTINIADLQAVAVGGYAVIPTNGDGFISRATLVCQAAVGASGGAMNLVTETGALSGYNITITDAAAAGAVFETGAIPYSVTNNSVVGGEAIWLDTSDGCTNAVAAQVVVEITRQ
ncbi:hypothetical protein LCGC14_0622250 [marine sediment metagenome]|uniref:Uncharacterized protein n=1 Tax=marine sediment metagenome TaxID=412755 RepID=A0A0F9R9H2_9ZZZZ